MFCKTWFKKANYGVVLCEQKTFFMRVWRREDRAILLICTKICFTLSAHMGLHLYILYYKIFISKSKLKALACKYVNKNGCLLFTLKLRVHSLVKEKTFRKSEFHESVKELEFSFVLNTLIKSVFCSYRTGHWHLVKNLATCSYHQIRVKSHGEVKSKLGSKVSQFFMRVEIIAYLFISLPLIKTAWLYFLLNFLLLHVTAP